MLSGAQNTRNLFEKRPTERAGLKDIIWTDTVWKWEEQGYPHTKDTRTVTKTVTEDGREVEREVEEEYERAVYPSDHFGFDIVGVGGGVGFAARFEPSELLEETDEWTVTRSSSGAVTKNWKRKSDTPEHIDFHMTTREIWEEHYRPHLLDIDRRRIDVPGTKKSLERCREDGFWTFFGNSLIWEGMRGSMGDFTMYQTLVLDPDWIVDYNRVYTDLYIAHTKLLLEEAGVPDGVWLYEDLGYNKGLFCSPQILADLVFPFYKEVVDFFHSYGVSVLLHSCGGVGEAMDMIVDCGFDALHPMEVAAGNNVLDYAEKYGDELVFCGGLDKRIIETGDRELIRSEVTAFMNGMKERGARFLFGSDHSISTLVDLPTYEFVVEVYRENMYY